jgi:GntR family transcriptional regulator, transcriptional repressor for pyruvate dehydrogenase complex
VRSVIRRYRPGDRLPSERDLAELLTVSRTTARAAVAVLEPDGLISVRRGRGGVRDALDYRSIVESGAARLAADRMTEHITNTHRIIEDWLER